MPTDHRSRSSRNALAADPIDRAHARRRDEEWVRLRLEDPAARVTFLWRGKHLVAGGDAPRAATLPAPEAGPLLAAADPAILLGQDGASAWFAADLPPDDDPPAALASVGTFRDLRGIMTLLPAREASLLAQARGLAHWHRRHRHCGVCGAPTRSAEAGHVRVCTAPACGESHFPRTDPAVIVLVTAGGRCLLGRQPSWPEGRYSTIAGFVEPGETLEEAVAREVAEETGVRVGRVEYHSSQPWPFPASLMLGFTAEAVETSITLDDELADARWFSRPEILDAMASGTLLLPGSQSIAYRLIEDWFDGEGAARLGAAAPRLW